MDIFQAIDRKVDVAESRRIINLVFLFELKNTSFYITYQVKCVDLYTLERAKSVLHCC